MGTFGYSRSLLSRGFSAAFGVDQGQAESSQKRRNERGVHSDEMRRERERERERGRESCVRGSRPQTNPVTVEHFAGEQSVASNYITADSYGVQRTFKTLLKTQCSAQFLRVPLTARR